MAGGECGWLQVTEGVRTVRRRRLAGFGGAGVDRRLESRRTLGWWSQRPQGHASDVGMASLWGLLLWAHCPTASFLQGISPGEWRAQLLLSLGSERGSGKRPYFGSSLQAPHPRILAPEGFSDLRASPRAPRAGERLGYTCNYSLSFFFFNLKKRRRRQALEMAQDLKSPTLTHEDPSRSLRPTYSCKLS